MDMTITVRELLLFLLALLAMGVLAYLIILLKNANKILSQLGKTFDSHEDDIDRTLTELPNITSNLSKVSDDVNKITGDVSNVLELTQGDIVELVQNISSISGKLENTSDNVFTTIDTVSETVSNSALNIESSISSLSDYILFALDVIDIIKRNFRKS